MAGDLAGALSEFPGSYRQERSILTYLIRSGGNYRGAVRHIASPLKKLYYSAYQAYLFNRILERRLQPSKNDPGMLFAGDLAWIHRSGRVFRVLDPRQEQPRADSFEISPSGPIFGKKMLSPGGVQEEIEAEVLREERLSISEFHQLMPGLHMRGGRRPLRVQVQELEYRLDGQDLVLEFFLPKGSYATTFLREIMKSDEIPPGFRESDVGEYGVADVELDTDAEPL